MTENLLDELRCVRLEQTIADRRITAADIDLVIKQLGVRFSSHSFLVYALTVRSVSIENK